MSTTKHPPTPDQAAARDHATARRDLVITAGAGTGKTSTLADHIAPALDAMGLLIAYVCYNASTAAEARGRFPRNTTCGTAHAFATKASRGKDGEPFWHHRLRGRKTGRGFQNARAVAKILGITDPAFFGQHGRLDPTELATIALRTVKAFCGTADPVITGAHVPQHPFLPDAVRADLEAAVLPHALRAWDDLRARNGLANDPSPAGCLNIEHDHYLKFWQLSGKPIMVRGPGGVERPADVIMFDEGQDANRVMAAIFKGQGQEWRSPDGQIVVPPRQLIIVGDQNQAINGWNGAIDIMGDFPDAARVELARSFRFGPAVADVANRWLALMDSTLRIVGHDPIPTVVGPIADPDAVLCRTNAGAMKAVLREHEAGRKVHLVGDGEEMKALAKAAITLEESSWTSHQDLRHFTSWGQVVEYCERGELGSEDLETGVALIQEFGPEAVIEAIEKLVTQRAADVTICTAHKSKGLEWDAVQIGDDFRGPTTDDDDVETAPDHEELMLSYVAVTRAKLRLDEGSLAWITGYLARHGITTTPSAPVAAAPAAPVPAPAAATVEPLTRAQARVDAARDPLTRSVALLALWEAMAAESPRDDAERAAFVRQLVAAYENPASESRTLAHAG